MIFIGNNAAGYLLIAFFISYATKSLKMPTPQILLATTLASFGWLIFTLVGGWLSDKIGRVKTFLIGYGIVFAWMIPMFALIDTKNIVLYGVALFVLTIGLGLSYGPMSAMYAEMFPANVRYSGISIGYAFGAILGGAFAATIAEALLQSTKWTGSIGIYIMILCVISAVGVLLAGETRGRPLGVSHHATGRHGKALVAVQQEGTDREVRALLSLQHAVRRTGSSRTTSSSAPAEGPVEAADGAELARDEQAEHGVASCCSDVCASSDATGTATTTAAAPAARTASTAARMVAPVARPSSARTTVLPAQVEAADRGYARGAAPQFCPLPGFHRRPAPTGGSRVQDAVHERPVRARAPRRRRSRRQGAEGRLVMAGDPELADRQDAKGRQEAAAAAAATGTPPRRGPAPRCPGVRGTAGGQRQGACRPLAVREAHAHGVPLPVSATCCRPAYVRRGRSNGRPEPPEPTRVLDVRRVDRMG